MKQKYTPPDRIRRSIDVIALIAFCGFFFIAGIQLVGLVGADEPRYAQVAREMLARHDWVTPVLYGHPWLEKPPLYYWCAMLAYQGAGVVSDIGGAHAVGNPVVAHGVFHLRVGAPVQAWNAA